jgi:hypothetical protein
MQRRNNDPAEQAFRHPSPEDSSAAGREQQDQEGQQAREGQGDQEDKSRQPSKKQADRSSKEGLSAKDLPDSSNESTGAIGSGQRQDSN